MAVHLNEKGELQINETSSELRSLGVSELIKRAQRLLTEVREARRSLKQAVLIVEGIRSKYGQNESKQPEVEKTEKSLERKVDVVNLLLDKLKEVFGKLLDRLSEVDEKEADEIKKILEEIESEEAETEPVKNEAEEVLLQPETQKEKAEEKEEEKKSEETKEEPTTVSSSSDEENIVIAALEEVKEKAKKVIDDSKTVVGDKEALKAKVDFAKSEDEVQKILQDSKTITAEQAEEFIKEAKKKGKGKGKGRSLEEWLKVLEEKGVPAKTRRQFKHIWESALERGESEEYATRAAIDILPEYALEKVTPAHGSEKSGPIKKKGSIDEEIRMELASLESNETKNGSGEEIMKEAAKSDWKEPVPPRFLHNPDTYRKTYDMKDTEDEAARKETSENEKWRDELKKLDRAWMYRGNVGGSGKILEPVKNVKKAELLLDRAYEAAFEAQAKDLIENPLKEALFKHMKEAGLDDSVIVDILTKSYVEASEQSFREVQKEATRLASLSTDDFVKEARSIRTAQLQMTTSPSVPVQNLQPEEEDPFKAYWKQKSERPLGAIV